MSCPHCEPAPQTVLSAQAATPTIVLVGNPNVGKSTLFNAVTGAHQAVVNAPGTTVEVMTGTWKKIGAHILDLPGTYSLVAQSPDEQLVVDTLAGIPGSFTDAAQGRSVDLVLCVLDAAALTRSLYLLAQVAKTGRPVAVVVTLCDVAEQEGRPVDLQALQTTLGIPVMGLDPRSHKDIHDLEDFVTAALHQRPRISGVQPDPTAPGYNQLAAAAAQNSCQDSCGCDQCDQPAPDSTQALHATSDADRAVEIFSWVDTVEKQIGVTSNEATRMSRSDKIDRLLLNPFIGIPVFFGLMWVLFMIAGGWVGPIQDFFDALFSSEESGAISLANGINALLAGVGLEESWLQGLLVGGLCTGLGVVASFLPLMFVIFLMISVLEDSGYMARAAFLGDRLMRKLGLDGRVILPLIMGFGCNLPSLAAARAMPNARQRLVTVLITPYTSCAARLTIYMMIARIFFPQHTGTVVMALYVLSIVMVIVGALALKPFFTKSEASAPLMLVLPAYQTPRIVVTLQTTWMRSWAFVKGAGKIIVAMTMVVWLMSAIPTTSGYAFGDGDMPMEDSLYGATAQVLEPVFAPTGFGEWHMTGALMTGFVAKETVISSIVVSYNLGEEQAGDAEDGGEDLGSLPDLIHASFAKSAGDAAPLAAFAFLVFVLTYTPCLATVAEQVRQIGGRVTTIAVFAQLVLAWVLAVGIFQIGRLFI